MASPISIERVRALPGYAVGIVNFHSYRELRACLESVAAQSHPSQGVFVLDHDAEPLQHRKLRAGFPAVAFRAGPNRGFAAGANELLAWVDASCPDAQFVLLLNPDVDLEPDHAANLVREATRRPRVALAGGKLLRPGGALDSAGIEMHRSRRPRDRGSEQRDRGQFERCETVFAVTGAAVLIRRAALADLAIGGEVFDADFFAYHEDTDLAWRASLLDWHALYVPNARATHARQWRSENRRGIERSVRRHSFKNHYLEMIKNERPGALLRDLHVILGWELLRLVYCALREPHLIGGYVAAARLAPRAWRKRRALVRRIRERRGSAVRPAWSAPRSLPSASP